MNDDSGAPAIASPPASRQQAVTIAGSASAWQLAVELPVEIDVNGEPIAVMLATPADLEELALGFLHTEHVLHEPELAQADAPPIDVTVDVQLDGIVVDVRVPVARVNGHARTLRRLEGRTGCGLCGIESLAALRRRGLRTGATANASPDDAALMRAFAALPGQQRLNQTTHSVHAAAWCAVDGALLVVREDVGRHNALDKLVGARLRSEVGHRASPAEQGFVVMTSRLSYELVYKAHALGATCLATISAPTSLALDTARQLGLELACLAPSVGDGAPCIARFPSLSRAVASPPLSGAEACEQARAQGQERC